MAQILVTNGIFLFGISNEIIYFFRYGDEQIDFWKSEQFIVSV